MSEKKIFYIISTILILLAISSQSLARTNLDSDGDGILDTHDNCPNTNPYEKLPIILRNPEYLGCSCSQILQQMKDEHCKEIYCFPERPLEIRNRATSSNPKPCPPNRCEGTTEYKYVTNTIQCVNGKEQPYTCEEQIIENSPNCEEKTTTQTITTKTTYQEITRTYLNNKYYLELLNMKTEQQLQQNHEDLLKNINLNKQLEETTRTINNREITTTDTIITIQPNKNTIIRNLIVLEKIKGDLKDKNLVIQGDHHYDEELQIITWTIPELKQPKTLTYRITPHRNIQTETILQGTIKKTTLQKTIIPLIILIILISITTYKIIMIKEKNKVFKK